MFAVGTECDPCKLQRLVCSAWSKNCNSDVIRVAPAGYPTIRHAEVRFASTPPALRGAYGNFETAPQRRELHIHISAISKNHRFSTAKHESEFFWGQ